MRPVIFNGTLEEALNLVGIFVFAISGALLAVRKQYDIVGMIVLAEITAIGGGVLRDLVLGAIPPAAFTGLGQKAPAFERGMHGRLDQHTDRAVLCSCASALALGHPGVGVYPETLPTAAGGDVTDHMSFVLPIAAAVLVFFAHARMNRIRAAVLVFDAAGLAVFCVAGTAKALAFGIGPVEAVALGALTGAGGGIMRDVLANEQPVVLRADSELYVVPAVLGSSIVVIVERMHLYGSVAAGLAALFAFMLRIAALRYGWRAPRPWHITNEQEVGKQTVQRSHGP